MQLNHLNLTVSDVEASRTFLERYFKLTSFPIPAEGMALMTDDQGMLVTLMRGKDVVYPRGFHIGFHQSSDAQVDLIHERMRADGLDVQVPSRQHGSWTFYFQSPGGFPVEVFHQAIGPTTPPAE